MCVSVGLHAKVGDFELAGAVDEQSDERREDAAAEDGAPVVRKRKVIFDPSIGRKLQHQNALEEFVDQMMREHYHRSECTLANEKT